MSIDYLFLFLSVWIAVISSDTKYRNISLILVADFCIFLGVDEIWIASSIPGGDWFLPLKGLLYICFYLIYMSAGSIYLSVLSGLVALYHFMPVVLIPYGIELTSYTDVMMIYCILQLTGAFIGGIYEYHNRFSPYRAWHKHHRLGD